MNDQIIQGVSAAVLTAILLTIWKLKGIYDVPSHRSAHSKAIPTAAGICIAFVFLIFFGVGQIDIIDYDSPPLTLVAGLTILTIVGFIDDWKEVNYKTRLLSHIVAVGLVLTQQKLNIPEYAIWFFIGVGLINACNFLDGLNGLLASQWLLTIGFILSAFAPENSFFWILWISTLVYLFYNFPKAVVFIGDTGSTILGFSYFCMLFSLAPIQNQFPSFIINHDSFIIFCLFPLGFAWADVAFTILRRFAEKRSMVWSFGDYGFHYKAKFLDSHALVTLIYLSLNCLLTFAAALIFSNHQLIYPLCCIYALGQIVHWAVIYRLSRMNLE